MRLEEIFAEVLQQPIEQFSDVSSPQTISQWNSLKHIELIMQIEMAYGTRFSHPEIASLRSLGAIRTILQKKGINAG
jgi:acyl carrier protein